eukprot:GFUD01010132.1.p1 GENE.GFUD01010132.1~~GFUD01010132.1.p1  ORF type:complete len:348 (-),score=86.68 GFUD01010132.1:718-1761(-)
MFRIGVERCSQLGLRHQQASQRTFCSLQANYKNNHLQPPPSHTLTLCKTRHMSTFESLYLKMISLPPVHFMEDTLAHVHDTTGLPWWATVMLSTGVLRLLLTMPAHITQQKVMAKRFLMSEEMKTDILPSLQSAVDRQVKVNKWAEKKARASYQRVAGQFHRQKVQEYNCHLAKMFLPVYIQIPAWIFTSVAIRNMATMRHSLERRLDSPIEERFYQFSSEGLAWCQNLSVPDPTFVLPVLVGLTFATTIYISSNKLQLSSFEQVSKYSRGLTITLYSLSFLMIPLASFQPAALALYWASSGAMGVFINLALLSPSLRRTVMIPKIPAELDKPYTTLRDKLLGGRSQ